ncbi:MAG: hypothetical protein QXD05_01245 [Candidatus Pacearchaeota archaeon]
MIFILYLILDVFISGFNDTIPIIIAYSATVDWLKLGISLILTLSIGFLVAINGVYIYILYKERKKCKEGKILAGTGTVGGLVIGVCPLCVTGLFPLIFGLLGLSFSFASLPFQGIEIQILIIIILLTSFKMLTKHRNI